MAASLIGQTCRGLAHLHAKDIAWRDVKPENILIGVDGQVVSVDHALISAVIFLISARFWQRLIDFGTASIGLTSNAASSHRAYTREVGTRCVISTHVLFDTLLSPSWC